MHTDAFEAQLSQERMIRLVGGGWSCALFFGLITYIVQHFAGVIDPSQAAQPIKSVEVSLEEVTELPKNEPVEKPKEELQEPVQSAQNVKSTPTLSTPKRSLPAEEQTTQSAPSDDEYGVGNHEETAFQRSRQESGTGGGTTAATVPPPPPAPAPRSGPIQLPENATAPVAISTPQPSFPTDARDQGLEATVVVKFVVTEMGTVTEVKVVKGHALFNDAVIQAVRNWKYRPALWEGKPTSVYRIAKIPFKIRS